MKLLLRIFFAFLGLVLLLGLGVYMFVQSDAPDYEATMELKGLNEQVEVFFDEYGIPHIYAENETDAYFGLGYVHASERLFQMEMLRRVANGKLSEILGPDLVDTDIHFRTLGLNEISKKAVKKYQSSETEGYQKAARAYLAGVNAFIAEGDDPLEFSIIGIEKTPFTMENLYDVVGYMAYGFANGLKQEPVVERIAEQWGPAYLEDLAITYRGTQRIHSYTNPDFQAPSSPSLSAKVHQIIEGLPVAQWMGSNAWVIAPERSGSGKVLFANDPHIGYGQPSVWFEAHMETPDFTMYGYHLAGSPFAPVGHTREYAVGLTMFLNDDTQFYREKANPDNPNQVMYKGEWVDLEVRKEIIKVKDGEDVEIEVRRSKHGPIVNDGFAQIKEEDPIALWWTYLEVENDLMEPSYMLAHANGIEDVQKAASMIVAPGLNVMYGDIHGNIGHWAAGKLPRYADSVNTAQYLDGTSDIHEPIGFYDFSENPQSVNPPWGYVYSANNQHDSVGNGYFPGYYASEQRAGRIVERIEEEQTWDVEKMKALALDDKANTALEIIDELLLDLPVPEGETEQKAIEILQDWDGHHGLDAIAPTIYYKFLYYTLRYQMEDELGTEDFVALLNHYLLQKSLLPLAQNRQSVWWDDQNTPNEKENRLNIVQAAFTRTMSDLKQQLGPNIDNWNWSKAHYLEHGHPLGQVPPMDQLFNVGPIPAPAGKEVINNISFSLDSTGRYRGTSGPSRRCIIDFADVEHSWSILPTGNSGHVSSPHYNDQAEMYARGEYRMQLLNRKEIEKGQKGHWVMMPIK